MKKDFAKAPHARRRLILSHLQEKRAVTRRFLANLCDCSLKTIQRDVEYLRNDRWPIDSLNDGYSLRKPSAAEKLTTKNQHLAALVIVGCAVDRRLAALAPKLAAGIKREFFKLEDIDDEWGVPERVTDAHEMPISEQQLECFGKLARHILHEEAVQFFYTAMGYEDEILREVFPVQLKERDGYWYLIGYDLQRKQGRVFSLARLNTVKLLERRSRMPSEKVITALLEMGDFSIWNSTAYTSQNIRVRMVDYAAWFVRDHPIHRTQRLEHISNNEVILTLKTGDMTGVSLWLRKFAPMVEVLEPASLRKSFIRDLKCALDRYAG